jgi:hypothetical protein
MALIVFAESLFNGSVFKVFINPGVIDRYHVFERPGYNSFAVSEHYQAVDNAVQRIQIVGNH